MNITEEALLYKNAIQNNLNVEISDEIAEKMAKLTDFVLSENEKYNLTAIKDKPKAAVLHIADSLTVSAFVKPGTLCDVGAGAGFPSLPLAVYREDLKITPVDATAKKVAFINSAAELLGLSNINAINGRAEELFATGEALRESFDTVTARAVANLPMLCELCAPAVKIGGQFISMKGENGNEELQGFEKAAAKLGLKLNSVNSVQLTDGIENYQRYIIVFDKVAHSASNLPRSFAQIKKKPLY